MPAIYGIRNSNRPDDELWTKNNFNSSLPIGLLCFMRDEGIEPVYLKIGDSNSIEHSFISVDSVFNTSLPNEDLYFSFETAFEPYQRFAIDALEKTDVVIAEAGRHAGDDGRNARGKLLRSLEVKLTVLPDSSTAEYDEEYWGAEIVFRPVVFKYVGAMMMASLEDDRSDLQAIMDPICGSISNWGNESEMLGSAEDILGLLDRIVASYKNHQQPIVLNPIWKTKGQAPQLANQCFDVFMWSDFSILKLAVDRARSSMSGRSIGRPLRTALWMGRLLYEFARGGNVHFGNVVSDMTYSYQTDKAMSVSGRVTRLIMDGPELREPRIAKSALTSLIDREGLGLLQPERRLDATIYFTALDLFSGD